MGLVKMLIGFLCLGCLLYLANGYTHFYTRDVDWKGNWFPVSPNEVDNNPSVQYKNDAEHTVQMGQSDGGCDNGKTNLTVDWYLSPENYTCLEDKALYRSHSGVAPLQTNDHIPPEYHAMHACMDQPITYDKDIPTFGTHRPLWAQYGEYIFLPKQRWLHNLEHGAVAMLYHPCADPNEVKLLRRIVTSCLYKHIITPDTQVSQKRPLALVSWGYRLEMSKVSPKIVINFIRKHALQGPELTPKDGQYNFMLKKHAEVVSDINDSSLCPNSNAINMK